MIEDDEVHLGLRPIDQPLIPWRELRPLRGNALRRAILEHRDAQPLEILRNELDRFLQADEQFFLAAARTLRGMKDTFWLDARGLDGGASPRGKRLAPACVSATSLTTASRCSSTPESCATAPCPRYAWPGQRCRSVLRRFKIIVRKSCRARRYQNHWPGGPSMCALGRNGFVS